MSAASPTLTRLYTVEEANAALPLVRMIVKDIVELSQSMMSRRELLGQIQREREDGDDDVYQEELRDIESCLKADADRLKAFVSELGELGVQLRSLSEGVVSFCSERDARNIYLGWKYGEETVAFWHEMKEGFESRRPVNPLPTNRLPKNTTSAPGKDT